MRGDHYAVAGVGMGSVEGRRDSMKRTRIEVALEGSETARNSSASQPPKTGSRSAEAGIEQKMRLRACRFKGKVAAS